MSSTILDRPLSKGRQEVSLSAFSFLFSEVVQHSLKGITATQELERKLEDFGHGIGARMLEVCCHREKGSKRETKILGILQFISSTVWKTLFGKVADSLEKGTDHEDEYMIREKDPLVSRFISVPKDMGHLHCGSFICGIIKGVLDNAMMPARVTAHWTEDGEKTITTFLMKFSSSAMQLGS